MSDSPLGTREEWHRRRGHRRQADADPACLGVRSRECADGLDHDVDRQREERQRDQLLCSPLCKLRRPTPPGEQPKDHSTRGELDQTVDPEGYEGDRACRDPGTRGDCELDQVPGVAALGQAPGSAFKTQSGIGERGHALILRSEDGWERCVRRLRLLLQ